MSSEYGLASDGTAVKFSTAHFTAEKGSILHSGIYNKELTASLAAGAVIFISAFFFADKIKINLGSSLIILLCFTALFLFIRTLILKDPMLIAVFDRSANSLNISLRSVFGEKQQAYALSDIAGISKKTVSLAPENPDGIKVVEKIALQHYTVIPGFGKTAEFHTVLLDMKDGNQLMLFSSKNKKSADEVFDGLNRILKLTAGDA
ncbi:MAG: hypothetical protein EPN22_02055 [Nitrospirae bacterium]|nr:MAG: hypothetical protein EPN22_02055 [Nitrospirota bacterium]